MDGNSEKLSRFYTENGKIFPNNTNIITGREAIKKRWTLPEGLTIKYHKVTPSEIKIIDDFAYDYGYYEGSSVSQKGESSFKGKYVIIWEKIDDDWKIYLDIWNNIK
jgi:ketosteroid isomerase-like protein